MFKSSYMFISFIMMSMIILPMNAISKDRVYHMRVTGYSKLHNKTANGGKAVANKTAAISPRCKHLLNEDVYIEGYGVRHINDLTARWLDNKYEHCTLDLAVCTSKECKLIGNKKKRVIHLKGGHKSRKHHNSKR